MRTILVTLFVLVAFIIGRYAQGEELSFVTLNGRKYERVEVSRVEPDALVVVTSDGIEKIPFSNLSPELQKRFGYDEAKAAAHSQSIRQKIESQKAAEAAAVREANDPLLATERMIANMDPALGAMMAEERKDLVKGITWLRGTVLQKTPKGLLVVTKHDSGFSGATVLVAAYPGQEALFDGDFVSGKVAFVGQYEYQAVTGANKTVRLVQWQSPLPTYSSFSRQRVK